MKTFPTLISLLALALAPALLHAVARAQTDDVFMVYGYIAPAGSMTVEGATSPALYLFWGSDDADLAAMGQGDTVTVEKDGQVIAGPFAFGEVLGAADIAALYAPASQSRRVAETMHALDDMFTGDAAVTPANFASRLHEVLTGQASCPGLGLSASACSTALRNVGKALARIDANVAIALRLGLRTTVPSAPATYLVRATRNGTNGLNRVLGAIAVDSSNLAITRRLAEPSALDDVSDEQQRCDTPGLAAHGSLALSWAQPVTSPATAKIEVHNIAGYHVFAGACGPGAVPAVDLHALAAVVNHDTQGGFTLPGLVRLTDVLSQAGDLPSIDAVAGRRLANDALGNWDASPGSGAGFVPPPGYANPTTPGWRATFAQLVASAQVVSAAGFHPGQELCVYIAAVDRAGQLGETASMRAQVADYETAVALDVLAETDSARDYDAVNSQYVDTDTFALTWQALEVANWLARDGSVACNPTEAATTRRLISAPTASACGDATQASPVDLAIDGYFVYRFDDPATAGAFRDTDGDGAADSGERTSNDDPGQACNDQAVVGTSHLVRVVAASDAAVDPFTGKRTLRFVDDSADSPAKAFNQGKVTWYAVAARATSGWVGPLSAPVRAYFPNKSAIDRPALEDITFAVCSPELVVPDPMEYPGFEFPAIALDDTDERRADDGKLRLYCLGFPDPDRDATMRIVDGFVGEAPFNINKASGRPMVIADNPTTGALYDEVFARREFESCAVYAEVVDVNGRVVAHSDPLGDLVQVFGMRTQSLTMVLRDSCLSGPAEPIQPGQVIDGDIQIKLPPGTPAGVCGDLEIEDAGASYRVATLCGNDLLTYKAPDTGGALQCYTLTLKGENQVPGLPLSLPCVKTKTSMAPATPQLDQLSLPPEDLGKDAEGNPVWQGSIRWKAPGAAVAGIILQLENRSTGSLRTDFFAASGAADPLVADPLGGFSPVQLNLDAALPAGATEQWCVKARSLSAATSDDLGGQLSDWAGPICGSRVHPGTALPNYLPWPTMTAPPVKTTPYYADYLPSDAMPYVVLGPLDPQVIWPAGIGNIEPECGPEDVPTCYTSIALNGGDACTEPSRAIRSKCIELCQQLDKAASDFRRIVGYRQTWDPSTSGWGSWIQVTSYIERFFCFVDEASFGARGLEFTLYDASFMAARFMPDANASASLASYKFVWPDRYPHEPGTKIRYQFVRFGAEGQIVETMPTTEVNVPAEVTP